MKKFEVTQVRAQTIFNQVYGHLSDLGIWNVANQRPPLTPFQYANDSCVARVFETVFLSKKLENTWYSQAQQAAR